MIGPSDGGMIVPWTHQPIVLYWRLSDFIIESLNPGTVISSYLHNLYQRPFLCLCLGSLYSRQNNCIPFFDAHLMCALAFKIEPFFREIKVGREWSCTFPVRGSVKSKWEHFKNFFELVTGTIYWLNLRFHISLKYIFFKSFFLQLIFCRIFSIYLTISVSGGRLHLKKSWNKSGKLFFFV